MKSTAQRKAEERDRMRKSGLVPLEVWVPKDKKEELKEYARELRLQNTITRWKLIADNLD